jgi:hypothetical protein
VIVVQPLNPKTRKEEGRGREERGRRRSSWLMVGSCISHFIIFFNL